MSKFLTLTKSSIIICKSTQNWSGISLILDRKPLVNPDEPYDAQRPLDLELRRYHEPWWLDLLRLSSSLVKTEESSPVKDIGCRDKFLKA